MSILDASFILERGTTENTLRKKCRASLIFGVKAHFAHSLQHPQALIVHYRLHTVQTPARNHCKKLTKLALSSFIPSVAQIVMMGITVLPFIWEIFLSSALGKWLVSERQL